MVKKTASSKTSSRKTTTSSSARKNSKTSGVAEPIIRRAKSAGWLAILESIIVGVLGGILIWKKDDVSQIIFYVIGIFLIVKGVYHIVNYFAVHGRYDFYNNDLFYGIIALIVGILCVVLWETLQGAIAVVAGAWMVYGSLVRMNSAIKLHAAGIREWFYVLLFSLVLLALGVYVLISVMLYNEPNVLMAVVGGVLIASAVVGVIDDFVFLRHVNAITE